MGTNLHVTPDVCGWVRWIWTEITPDRSLMSRLHASRSPPPVSLALTRDYFPPAQQSCRIQTISGNMIITRLPMETRG